MQRILVTGANGFLGYYLIGQLIDKQFNVLATGKGPCRLPFTGPQFLYQSMDFTNNKDIQKVFEQYQPSVVLHCGALSKPDECEQEKMRAFDVNVNGTVHLLEASARYGAFFLFLSTDFVFSGREGMYTENDPRQPVNYYGETKMMAEDAVMNYSFPWTIVRTVLVYGKALSGRQNLLTNTAIALRKGERLKIFTDQERTPTYVEDLANAIVVLIEKKVPGIFHISGADRLTPYDMALAVARQLNLDEDLITGVEEKDFHQPAKRPKKTGFDIGKARREIGFVPVGFGEGVKRTFS